MTSSDSLTFSIFSYAEVEEGDIFSSTLTGNIIKRLYATKYFDDIDVTLEFNTLIIRVKEKPIISEIKLEGNKIVEKHKEGKTLTLRILLQISKA